MAISNAADNCVGKKNTPVPGTLLTTREAAVYLAVSEAWLERQRWLRTGPVFIRVGRAVRYRQADLEAYLKENEVSAPAA